MAKTKKTARKKDKAKPKSKGRFHVARAATPRAERPKGPRSVSLPGMEQARHQRLDNLCEGIGEQRDVMNAATSEEKGLIQSALKYMTEASLDIYRHGGIELARIPGADKLRVRKTKEEGDAHVGDLDGDSGVEDVEEP